MKVLTASLLAAVTVTTAATTQANVPILVTDIEEKQVIINGGIAQASYTYDVDSSLIGNSRTDTDVQATTFGLGLSGSSNSANGLIPILLLDVSRLDPESADDTTNMYSINAGFALPAGKGKHVFTVNYQDYSDSDFRGSIGANANLRLSSGKTRDTALDLQLGLDLEENTDEVSGGDSFAIGIKAKSPLRENLYLTLSGTLDITTDQDYSNGLVREALPGLNGALGLHVLANKNTNIAFNIAYFIQDYEYYNESNTLLATEETDGLAVGLNVNLAF